MVSSAKKSLSGWHRRTVGGCKEPENLTVPKPLRTGTGALNQECFMHSRFSAPQTQVWIRLWGLRNAKIFSALCKCPWSACATRSGIFSVSWYR